MKKEEPSVNSSRENPSGQVDLNRSGGAGSETTGSLSRPGRTATARTEQPALSRAFEFSMAVAVDDSNVDATPPVTTRVPDLPPSSNRLVRTRMLGGVGAGAGNGPGYPITPGMGVILWGASPLYERESLGAQYTKCPLQLAKY
jgi:hypothetical protein